MSNKRINVEVSDGLHKRVKLEALRQNKTIKDLVVTLLVNYIREPKRAN